MSELFPYEATMEYHAFGGGITRWRISEMPTQEAAWHAVLLWALNDGWTPPVWWQWWRRREPQPPREALTQGHVIVPGSTKPGKTFWANPDA